jgi:hypothetical protein
VIVSLFDLDFVAIAFSYELLLAFPSFSSSYYFQSREP